MSHEPQAPVTATEQALAAYFDSLLLRDESAPRLQAPAAAPAAVDAADAPATSSPTGLRYRLVRALGLTLAVPEGQVADVVPALSLGTAATPGPAWSAGTIRWRDRQIPVIDPAAWLLAPAQRAALAGQPAALRAAAAAIVAEGRMALGCDTVGDAVVIEPAGVNWRKPGTGSGRPWLAGTIPASGWVLIDADAMAGMLA